MASTKTNLSPPQRYRLAATGIVPTALTPPGQMGACYRRRKSMPAIHRSGMCRSGSRNDANNEQYCGKPRARESAQ